MSKRNFNSIIKFLNQGRLETSLTHASECSIQTFTYVLIWWVWELIQKSDDLWITRVSFLEDILNRDMTWKFAGADDLHSIVVNINVNIIFNPIVTMENSICNNLVYGNRRIA